MISNFIRGGKGNLENGDILFRGVTELRTVEDMGEGGVKKLEKSGDVLYGRPQKVLT